MKRGLIGLSLAAALALSFAFGTATADAKGCIKGAIVGGIAGHAAHHGLIGAAAGCVIGHHEAAKHAKEQRAHELQQQEGRQQPAPAPSGNKP